MGLRLFVLFMALFTFLQIDLYSAIKIEITPKMFTGEGGQTTVKVACTLDKNEDSAKEIAMMKIARKGGRGMVTMDGNSTIELGNAEEDEVTVTGAVDKEILKSYLTMEIKEPETEDTGAYFCIVNYTMPSGTVMTNKANGKLVVNDPEVKKINSKVSELLQKVKMEQDNLKVIKDKEQKDKTKVVDLEVKTKKQEGELTDLLEKEKEVENKVTDLEEKTQKQLKKIEELSNKEETEVKSLKDKIKTVMDKMKKDEEEIQNIGSKEAEDKVKVTDLQEKAEAQTKDLQDLAEKEKKVENKVLTLEKDTKDALKKVQEFAKKESTDTSKVKDLEEKAEKQTKDLEVLTDKETEVESRIAILEESVESFLQKVNDLKGKVKAGVDKPSTSTNTGGGGGTPTNTGGSFSTATSAFSATIQNGYTKVSKGQTLVFPDLVMQTGMNGYSVQTGVYTAPVDGLYSFSVALKVNCISCYVRVVLAAGDKTILRLKVGVVYDEGQNSASSVTLLKKNQKVRVYTDYTTEGTVLSPNRLCLFSGFLVRST